MRWVKLAALILAWASFFILVVLLHLAITVLRLPGRWRIISRATRCLAASLRNILNVKMTIEGHWDRLASSGYFIISNHVGYLDGVILGSLLPVLYVSKREVRHWPVIGAWTALCGTVFIDRERKDKVPLLVEEMVKKLRQRANVLIFPEGTSTNGEKLLPFQSTPFAAPLRMHAPILPISIIYKRIDGQAVSPSNRDRVYWYGDMEFAGHLWNLLALRSIDAVVKVHPRIDTTGLKNDSLSRKQLSQVCYDAVLSGLDLRVQKSAPAGSLLRKN
ncbi:MAG TPA: lysophospholipid acyltransferase family protein [Candidatus Binatia bacterium]|jgi:1-acyl-sn-glycerol-3-phosphate acyltransferase|nr:lysophospholipid acyltransferase family protein [Candidatus Binatia bacterium]